MSHRQVFTDKFNSLKKCKIGIKMALITVKFGEIENKLGYLVKGWYGVSRFHVCMF